MAFLERLFSTQGFMPNGMCYEWNPAVIWLHIVSDGLIALAYYSIPLTLLYFVRKRTDLVFHWMFVCFAIFIVACGTTHLMEIVNIWHPTYWLSGLIKAITAATSIVTAVLLIRVIPQALALPSPAQLQRSNEALQKEIQERTKAVEQIALLNRQLVLKNGEIEQANAELETFSYSVSHDLRAPLRHIHGYMELLGEKASLLGEEGERYVRKAAAVARRMGALIDDLLAFSRMSKSAMQIRPTQTALLIKQAREELAHEIKERNIAWTIGTLPDVEADETLFLQVWLNLLGNAVKYTKNRERAEITIGSRENDEEFEFFVKDNGAGFDMRYADKLFGVFQRLHRTDEFDGNGIGLANVQRIIQRHGGKIWAEAKVNGGATFFFTVPKRSPGALKKECEPGLALA
jgi:signal transduction histidine kinase